jgi:hypothetical protein
MAVDQTIWLCLSFVRAALSLALAANRVDVWYDSYET